MKIVTVIGARPQFIKASVLSHKIKEKKSIEEIIIHTGQHYDQNMSKVFFDQLGINEPKYLLIQENVMELGYQVAEIEKYFETKLCCFIWRHKFHISWSISCIKIRFKYCSC